jgi:hypothetical protein
MAPRRLAWLAAAWLVAVVALFLPGCDMSGSGNGGEPAPTYVAYGLSFAQLQEYAGRLEGAARGGSVPELGGAPMTIACALFPVGSGVLLFSPLLLKRRLRRRLRWLGWTTAGLLLAPWLLPLAAMLTGDGYHFLYGFYLLAAAHTVAFVVILLPHQPKS